VLVSGSAWAGPSIELPLPGGPRERALTTAFPQKGTMILQRTRPPLLETPFEVFDRGVFTPNDQFYVRWHWAVIPTEINVDTFRLSVGGHVDKALSLSLKDIVDGLPRTELAAVNQCSGNSRGLAQPAVPGAQWANGAMGNAKWMGVRLKDVLDRAGVKPGALRVRFAGLDQPVVDGAPKFMKSLALDHARDGEVMIAYAMNGGQLPLLNGFPLRLVVPGWYSTYWVKMLDRIEVIATEDENFWTKNAYLIPDTPGANMTPGQAGMKNGADQQDGAALLRHQSQGRRHAQGRCADACARHRLRRLDRGEGRRHLARRWRQLAADDARTGRGHVQLPPMADRDRGAGRSRVGHGPLHQQRRPRPAQDDELERGWLHAQRHRNNPPDGSVRRT
jgi:DMSO/TMAO reductase YedYZ molybdopterin-dependent catalytic subunit